MTFVNGNWIILSLLYLLWVRRISRMSGLQGSTICKSQPGMMLFWGMWGSSTAKFSYTSSIQYTAVRSFIKHDLIPPEAVWNSLKTYSAIYWPLSLSLQIRQLLSDRFGLEKVCDSVDPDEVVAYGAGVQAAGISGLTQATLIDVASHSLGMKSIGDIMVRHLCLWG